MCESVRVLAANLSTRVPGSGIHKIEAEEGISHELFS